MAPILIDNRGIKKLVLISVLTTVIVFAAGFLSGYQRATTFYAVGSKIETLSLPVQDALLESDIQPQSPGIVVAGEELDVDQPQVELHTNTKVNSIASMKTIELSNDSAVKAKVSLSVDNKKVNNTNETPLSSKRVVSAQASKLSNEIAGEDTGIRYNSRKLSIKEEVASNKNQNKSVEAVTTKEPTKEPKLVVITALTSDELNNIQYSIQVGMYGRLINAENMMGMLQAQHLDAYVSDYINKKNESRYNVRFGYFVDKKSALTALKLYKNEQKGDGYLVKFSVENITNLADAKNIKQSITTEKTKKNSSPETVPSEVVTIEAGQEKISHTDVITASNVLAKAQDGTSD